MTTSVPAKPKIYHIVHVDKLPSIVADGCLWSDAIMRQREGGTVIGMESIKQKRLQLPVSCHRELSVGQCVPFYFCPRSVMLYVIHRANHPGLDYQGGQESIIHLEADLHNVVKWAAENRRRWAFSLSNAGASYSLFCTGLGRLGQINWPAVKATDFRSEEIKEGKQAEFLMEQRFPWQLFDRVGVFSLAHVPAVSKALSGSKHRPSIEVKTDWYY